MADYKDLSKCGYSRGDMSPKIIDMQKPEGCYSQKYDQSPTRYVERQNSRQMKAGSKLKSEALNGKY